MSETEYQLLAATPGWYALTPNEDCTAFVREPIIGWAFERFPGRDHPFVAAIPLTVEIPEFPHGIVLHPDGTVEAIGDMKLDAGPTAADNERAALEYLKLEPRRSSPMPARQEPKQVRAPRVRLRIVK